MPTKDRRIPDGSGSLAPPGPRATVVIAGTATEVGKTWVSARVAELLRRAGLVVAARKPAQSHDAGDRDTDAAILAAATGESLRRVCRQDRDYPVSMAPPMAADSLGLPAFRVSDLVAELEWPDECDIGIVESAGGICSPIACDGDTVELIRQLRPDLVLLVADAGLGVINAVRLCMALTDQTRTVVVLNRFDEAEELHLRNRDWLRDIDGFDVVTSPQAVSEIILDLVSESS